MNLNIAIHPRATSFSDRWIAYLNEQKIPYRIVDCFASDIIEQLADADVLLWHFVQDSMRDLLCAPRLLQAVEAKGTLVFPNHATRWHFDDKVAQKYLLEGVGAPLAPSWVFYSLESATAWVEQTTFPKVFKLSRGAGSQNVQLVRTAGQAKQLIRQAFSRGFKASKSVFDDLRTKARRHKAKRDWSETLKRLPTGLLTRIRFNRAMPRERGYAYFQEFLPNNPWDMRVCIVGGRAWGFTREVRPNDFRASGSGLVGYDMSKIDPRCVRIGFDVARKLGTQSMAFDFIYDANHEPRILEVSFGFVPSLIHDCPGHWDEQLNWHVGHLWPQDAIMMDLLDEARRRREQEYDH